MGFVNNFFSSSFPHQHIIKNTGIKAAHFYLVTVIRTTTPHTPATALCVSELLVGPSAHPIKPRSHQLRSQLKENWVRLVQFCAFLQNYINSHSSSTQCCIFLPLCDQLPAWTHCCLTRRMIQILSAHFKSNSFSQLPGNIISNQLKHSFVQQSP